MPSLAISITTIPVVGLILMARCVARTTLELGALSEEVFRGDRLPILTFPIEPKENLE